jgi:hypothetical protein
MEVGGVMSICVFPPGAYSPFYRHHVVLSVLCLRERAVSRELVVRTIIQEQLCCPHKPHFSVERWCTNRADPCQESIQVIFFGAA